MKLVEVVLLVALLGIAIPVLCSAELTIKQYKTKTLELMEEIYLAREATINKENL